MVRIRLARAGAKKKPLYRIVAADKRMKRDGRFLEKLGTFNPMTKQLVIQKERIEKWLSEGASASESVVKLLNKEGFNLKTTFTPKQKAEKKVPEKEAAKEEAPKAEKAADEAPKEAAKEEAPKAEKAADEAPKEEEAAKEDAAEESA